MRLKKLDNITAEFVRSILIYDPLTGIFTWKERSDVYKKWNDSFKGKIAGTLVKNTGCLRICINNKRYLSHRLAWLYMTGKWPIEEIDHKDLNRSNNKWGNLRQATHSQNQHNQAARKKNSSGYKGVGYNKKSGKWTACIRVNNVSKHLGTFRSPKEAHLAYCTASAKYHGEFSRVA